MNEKIDICKKLKLFKESKMLNNDLVNRFIKDVYEVISKEICLKTYMSPDKTKIMKVWNIKHNTPEMRHFIYSKEDISLSNFLFRVDVYINNEDIEECCHYVKWMSIIELWNEKWVEISHDHFMKVRKEIEDKFNTLKL